MLCTDENMACSACFARKHRAGRAVATVKANRVSGFRQRFANPTLQLFLISVGKVVVTWQKSVF